MNAVQKIVERIEGAELALKVDVDAIPASRRPGHILAQQQAQVDLQKAKNEYGVATRSSALVLLLSGPQQQEFAALVTEELKGEVIVLDGHAVYKEIAAPMRASVLGNRRIGPDQLSIYLGSLRDLARDLGVVEFVRPDLFVAEGITTDEELVEVVRQMTARIDGEFFSKLYIEKRIAEIALAHRYSQSVMPVIVTGLTDEEIESLKRTLFNGDRNFAVACNEVTKKSVLNTLTTIKKKLK